jgi:hypothetical protein
MGWKTFAYVAVIFISACGPTSTPAGETATPPAPSIPTGTVTLTGALNGSAECTVTIHGGSSTIAVDIDQTSAPVSFEGFLFFTYIRGTDLQATTYDQTSAADPLGTMTQVYNPNGVGRWSQIFQDGSSINQGTYKFVVTSTGAKLVDSQGTSWVNQGDLQVHGTLDAVLPMGPGAGSATGTNPVMAHVEF